MHRQTITLPRPGCDLHVEVTGQGPALIFAHGLGGNHMSWFHQVAHFAPRFRCVTFAHRGFWPSGAIPGGPDPVAYGGDLAAIMDELVLDPAIVVAQSMGGWTGVELALRHPGRLRGLVMAATTGSVSLETLGAPGELAAWQAASAAGLTDLLAAGGHPAFGRRMLQEQPAMAQLYRHIGETSRGLDKEALRARMTAMRRRAPEELAATGCPVLLIGNAEDVVMPPFAAAAIAARVPGAKALMIAKAGHSAYFERPEAFNGLVENFIAEL